MLLQNSMSGQVFFSAFYLISQIAKKENAGKVGFCVYNDNSDMLLNMDKNNK